MTEGKRAKVYLAACGFSNFLLSARRASSRARCSSSALLSQRFSSSFSSLFVVQRGARRVLHNRATAHAQARDARANQPATSKSPYWALIQRQITTPGVLMCPACGAHSHAPNSSISPPRAALNSIYIQHLFSRCVLSSIPRLRKPSWPPCWPLPSLLFFFFVFLTVLRRDSILSTKSANSPSTRRRHKINCFASSRSSSAVRRALDAFSHPFSAVVLSRILGTYSAGRASKRTVMLRPPSSALSS